MIRAVVAAVAPAAVFLPATHPAAAAVPVSRIAFPDAPLAEIAVGADLGCQVRLRGEAAYATEPPDEIAGGCGTYLTAAGETIGPDTASRTTNWLADPARVWRTRLQTVTGAGTPASPREVLSIATVVEPDLAVTQRDRYVAGDDAFRTELSVANRSGAAQDVRPPVTVARVAIRGPRAVIRLSGRDPAGVLATYARVGAGPARRVAGALTVPVARLGDVRFGSVDRAGNVEEPRGLPPAGG